MNEVAAKLKAIRERTKGLMEIHASPPKILFDNLQNQFFIEEEKLKIQFPLLADFKHENYNRYLSGQDNYFKWAPKALIHDIDYFLNFLNDIDNIQFPNLKVSNEGIYFAGQHFDALLKFNEIISNAKKEIILIDSYINEKVLEVLASKKENVVCRILTFEKSVSKSLSVFIEAFRKQYENLEIKYSNKFHDRFVIIDGKEFYHFGASIKDAGNRGFMFSKIEQDFIKENLLNKFEEQWNKKVESN